MFHVEHFCMWLLKIKLEIGLCEACIEEAAESQGRADRNCAAEARAQLALQRNAVVN
jgi:hypothetical protein